ncbi:lipocalin family protein [Saprospira sp. CCB-QB6]|uniref:lipocalin family protein n=1 Tax=Saprospira sp. CCB-QB6 TaxID=3023936 RepID=UPI00234A2F5B|nr:lipocalin family protein [Saprospira sp. CCB-QB6]WCL82864.1 lipocalin family protein [Saprospira sp. CCB-QB6]
MKNLMFLFMAVLAFGLGSCNSEAPAALVEQGLEVTTRGQQAEEKAENFTAGKWEDQNTFVNLKLDGTFEASFDGETTIVGSWILSDDEKQLSLKAEESLEGKGSVFAKTYEVLEITPESLKVKDDEGQELAFKAA